MTLTLFSHCTPVNPKALFVKYDPNRVTQKVESIYALKKRIFVWFDMTHKICLQTSFKVTAYHLTIGTLWVNYEPDWTNGRKDMRQKRIFLIILLLPLHFTLRFQVTAHPSAKGTLWVKYQYEPDWAKGRADMLRIRDLGRTDRRNVGWTDRQTD